MDSILNYKEIFDRIYKIDWIFLFRVNFLMKLTLPNPPDGGNKPAITDPHHYDAIVSNHRK